MECNIRRPALILKNTMADAVLLIRSLLFRLIITFLHLVYSGLEHFDVAWALFKRKLQRVFQLREIDSQLYVSRFATTLEKCPTHFAVITGNEKINYEDFSNLVNWSVAAGISYISFYDCTGYLKNNQETYFKYLINEGKVDPHYVIFNSKHNGIKNGFKRKIHINILSIEDGKPLFAKLVENLCTEAINNEIKTVDIDESVIDEKIHEMIGFMDPELAVICGKVQSTYGFLPWHIRLTEFLQVSSIENISVIEFTSILKKYSLVSQRFGK